MTFLEVSQKNLLRFYTFASNIVMQPLPIKSVKIITVISIITVLLKCCN